MLSSDFPLSPEWEANPYAAPLAEISAPPPEFEQADDADEALRRQHLTHESRVRSIGFLGFAGMFFWGLYGVFAVVAGIVLGVLAVIVKSVPMQALLGCLALIGLGILSLAIALAGFTLARGLRRLRSWARWTWAVCFSLPIVGACIAAIVYAVLGVMGRIEDLREDIPGILGVFGLYVLLPAWLLYLLLCRESGVIFTPEYRAVVARTPHIRYKMGRRTKWVAMLLVIALIAALVVALPFL